MMGNLSQRLRGVVSPLVLYRFLPGDEAAFLRVVSFVEVRVNGLFSGDGANILFWGGGEMAERPKDAVPPLVQYFPS